MTELSIGTGVADGDLHEFSDFFREYTKVAYDVKSVKLTLLRT